MVNKGLIAPCGMDCRLCLGYQREKNKCPGCRKRDAYKASYGRKCFIRSCLVLKEKGMEFCSEKCEKYPCKRLKDLDKRYRIRYGMSMVENLENIEKLGIKKFFNNQNKRWACKKCRGLLCVHRDFCLECGK